ncbi:MAG: TetR/AcrR family transcriptional regulator [Rhizobiales bacterium]|nr:TetR/AcrR family transcriptional regulator [Hyphomicrobiales bacterium]
MARKTSGTRRQSEPRPSRATAAVNGPSGSAAGSIRDRIIAAFLGLLAEKSFEAIGFAEIAERAGATLADVRNEFDSTLRIHAAHAKAIDRAVLGGDEGDMSEESPRERLFDVLMRRLDILAPHKAAVRSLLRSARRNPPLALALNGVAVRSQQWMLAAAGIDSAGPRGMLRAQGLALLFAQVLSVWIEDDDPGLARTMAALDRTLGRGARWAGFLDDLCRLVPPRCPSLRRRRRPGYDEDRDAPATA